MLAGAVWEKLRGTRWSPPAAAASDSLRRRTYVFALEQAEQMFRAATTAGVATQPLQVFYGLSQAGRAIAAAAPALTGEDWKLAGHGLHCDPATLRGPLPGIRLETGKRGGSPSFVRLSELLGSPVWASSELVALNTLWDCLPENRLFSLEDAGEARTTPLSVDYRSLLAEPHPLVSVPVIYFPPQVVASPEGGMALAAYMSRLPDVPPWHSFHKVSAAPDAAPNFSIHSDGWGELVMNWAHPGGQAGTPADHLAYLRAMTRPYRGDLWLFPRAGDTGPSMHPLMTWWAVLFTLSMLARYQPAEWAAHINVDDSPHAVPIERLLARAISTIPELVAEAIEQVTGPHVQPLLVEHVARGGRGHHPAGRPARRRRSPRA